MKTKEIQKLLEEEMKAGIQLVLSGKRKEFESKFITAEMASKYMKKLKFESTENDTNGWQADRWNFYRKGKDDFCVFTTGWDGTFIFSRE